MRRAAATSRRRGRASCAASTRLPSTITPRAPAAASTRAMMGMFRKAGRNAGANSAARKKKVATPRARIATWASTSRARGPGGSRRMGRIPLPLPGRRGPDLAFATAIAYAAHRLDIAGVGRVVFQLLPHAGDMDIHHAGVEVFIAPDPVEELVTG